MGGLRGYQENRGEEGDGLKRWHDGLSLQIWNGIFFLSCQVEGMGWRWGYQGVRREVGEELEEWQSQKARSVKDDKKLVQCFLIMMTLHPEGEISERVSE